MVYDSKSTKLLKLVRNGKHQRLPKGHNLQIGNSQSSLTTLRSGYIKRYLITQDGSESIQAIFGPGDIFPLTPVYRLVFGQDLYYGGETPYYKTMTEADVSSIELVKLQAELELDPMLYKDLLYVAGKRKRSNIQRLDNTSLRVAHRRIAHQLIYLAEKFGETTPDGIKITVPLTHDDIAAVLNLARETVSLCLRRLREKGLIETNRHIVIPDIDKLQQEIH